MSTPDQYLINQLQYYSASYTDGVFYGNVLSNNATQYKVQISGSVLTDITESIDPFQRSLIWSKAFSLGTLELKKRNLLYSDRIKFKQGKTFGGSKTANAYLTLVCSEEQVYDSFLPSPLDISKVNNVDYAFMSSVSGSLQASTNFSLPAAGGNDIPIIFGKSVPTSLLNVSGAIDTTWLTNPFPFQARYKTLSRITNESYILPEKQDVSVDFSTGQLISPVSQSDVIGTVYYISAQEPEGFTNSIYEGEHQDRLIAAPFTEMNFPEGVSLTSSFYGSHAHDFAGSAFGQNSEAQQILVGTNGLIVKRQEGTLGWSIVQEGLSYHLSGASSSRGPNFFGFQQFGYWALVGTGGTILTNDDYALGSNFTTVSANGYTGNFTGVAYECADSTFNSANKFVAVGTNGEIQHSTDYTGATWSRPTGSPYGAGAFDFYDIDYDVTHDMFIAVGTGGVIYYSAAGDPTTTWTQVSQTGNLSGFTDDLFTVCCHYGGGGQIVVAGANGAIATCDASPISPANWTVQTAASSYTGTFRGSARSSNDSTGGGDYLFYLVGDNGMIQACKDDGDSWEEIIESPNDTNLQYNTITSKGLWPDPSKQWPTTGDYIVAGDAYFTTKNAIGRVVDIESTSYSYDQESGGFVNTGDLISPGGSGLSIGSSYTRSKLSDGLKTFFGIGPGVSIQLPDTFLPGTIDFLPGVAVDFHDIKTITDDNQVEFFRFIGPKPLGYRYGIYNTKPTGTKCVFRRDHFGHPRDMLEQRQLTKFFLPSSDTTNQTITQGAVVVTFVSGTQSYDRAKMYLTASSEVSFNKKDSGIYDFECKAGQPFYDDQVGLEE